MLYPSLFTGKNEAVNKYNCVTTNRGVFLYGKYEIQGVRNGIWMGDN